MYVNAHMYIYGIYIMLCVYINKCTYLLCNISLRIILFHLSFLTYNCLFLIVNTMSNMMMNMMFNILLIEYDQNFSSSLYKKSWTK